MALIAVIVFIAVSIVSVVGAPASATFPGIDGRLAFVRTPSTAAPDATPLHKEIWTINADGTDALRLTEGGWTLEPTWSPDGRQLAFIDAGNDYRIGVMNADGSARRLISSDWVNDAEGLTWSTDGSRMAAGQAGDIHKFDVVSGVKTPLITGSSDDSRPEYSPDGKYLAWVRSQIQNDFPGGPYSGSVSLMRADEDGSNPTVLSEVITSGEHLLPMQPRWHSDSGKLEWEYRLGAVYHHTRVSSEGSLLNHVIGGLPRGWLPSPQGERLAVNSSGRNHLAALDGTLLFALPEPPDGWYDWPVTSWQSPTDQPDSLAPSVQIDSPAEGSETVLDSPLTASYSCADESGGSGLASCAGTAANGAALDTSVVGEKSFTVTATDNAGNTETVSVSYRVVWPFSSFVGSVDPLPTLNATKAGGVVPVRFSLGGDRGLGILAPGSPTSAQISCDPSVPVDLVEETAVSPGANALSYDAATGQYAYNWKTNKAWNNTCRQLTFELVDGASYQANFRFS